MLLLLKQLVPINGPIEARSRSFRRRAFAVRHPWDRGLLRAAAATIGEAHDDDGRRRQRAAQQRLLFRWADCGLALLMVSSPMFGAVLELLRLLWRGSSDNAPAGKSRLTSSLTCVSVIVPTYNEAESITATLASIDAATPFNGAQLMY